MNILFVNSIFPQPSQTFVLDQIRYARGLGHAVTVYCKRFKRSLARESRARFDLFAITIYDRPRSLTTGFRLLKGLVLHPRRLAHYLRMRRALALHFSDFICAAQVSCEPDVIVANFGPNGIVAARIKACFFPTARLVVIFHGYDVSAYVAANGWEGYRRAGPMIDAAITVNRQWARSLRANTTIANVSVNHLGVDLTSIPPWKGHGPDAIFTILFVGRMVEKKGLRVLLDAVAELRARGVRALVHAIGEGSQLDDLTATVTQMGLADAVFIHGRQPHDFVLDLMTRADCLALPSLIAADGDQEGIPVTLMEAMACGLPVVSTFHSGIPELVANEETGLLVPERDAGALALALERLMGDEGLRRRLAANARRVVAAEFNAAIQNPALFDLILGAPDRRDAHDALPQEKVVA